MGVPWYVNVAVFYTVGSVVLMPIQAAFLVYDVAVFMRKAATYTKKGVFYVQSWNANRRAKKVRALSHKPPEPEGDWVEMGAVDADGFRSPDKMLKIQIVEAGARATPA